MTYRTDLAKELKYIRFSKKKEGRQLFEGGYYLYREIINYLLQGTEIKTYAKKTLEFAKLFNVCSHTIRNRTIQKKYIYLKRGYYQKDFLIKYLLTNFK